MNFRGLLFLLVSLPALTFSSCTTLKPYEKARLHLEDMQPAPRAEEWAEQDFQYYREGAAGGSGGKTGGGCGCN